MDFTEIEVVEAPLWYGKCTYGERNDINTEHLFIVSLKTLKKEREKKNLHAPGVDHGYFPMRTCPLPAELSEHAMNETKKIKITIN